MRNITPARLLPRNFWMGQNLSSLIDTNQVVIEKVNDDDPDDAHVNGGGDDVLRNGYSSSYAATLAISNVPGHVSISSIDEDKVDLTEFPQINGFTTLMTMVSEGSIIIDITANHSVTINGESPSSLRNSSFYLASSDAEPVPACQSPSTNKPSEATSSSSCRL
ncbi:unnamed protein product [Vitrella brassicaformis CCMP3155]|uniref:Uncharacterized protein n=1 Tax=Vitrella brassicaformis (strain CCMP3155) TaxID=1169540 RepID=A0A0G4GAI7_VITBC|nr:unnamed protein product [Vitrella brassicaformis CCMP3155]|eukprot:CEM25989.1 unnamed protein product [Vitrella brassicaformis CCMP3155]